MNLTGQSLGRYHILEPLGEGGMAVVYKAYDTHLENEMAVKIIRTDHLGPAVLNRALKRFEREARSVAKLNHPGIVSVVDYGEYEGSPYLVMPYLPGGTLKQYLRQHGRLPWQEAARLLIPVAEALAYAHHMNLIHRDVKPANILLTAKGLPMLTDFGVAKVLDEDTTQDLTGTAATVGTPEYMAPEQVMSKTVDHRADIYALGVVFFEMLAGRRPFEADTPMAVLVKHASEPLPRISDLVPGLPLEVERVLIKALQKKPDDRYPDMETFSAALRALINTGVVATPPSLTTQVQQPVKTPAVFPAQESFVQVKKPAQVVRTSAQTVPRQQGKRLPLWLFLSIGVISVALITVLLIGITKGWFAPGHNPETTEFITKPPRAATATSTTNTLVFTEMPTQMISMTSVGPQYYTVKENDDCWSLAEAFNVDLLVLLAVNDFPTGSCPLVPGMKILIPEPGQEMPTPTPLPSDIARGTEIEYTILIGDTIKDIAAKFNSTKEDIMTVNNIKDENLIFVGQLIIIRVNLVTPTATATFIASDVIMPMVFVPAGKFLMGSYDGDADEQPEHTVNLDDFYIDQTEVTNAMFARFVEETGYRTDAETAGTSYALVGIEWPEVSGADWQHPFGPSSNIDGLDDHPVIHVSWNDAKAYCEWAGKRLPTEAEWEKAARGTDGAIYPWGNRSPAGNLLNYADANTNFDWSVRSVDDGYKYTSPAGNYPDGASPYGALDMAGNVWEWVADWYGKDYYSQSPEDNPTGPASGTKRVMRGGAWDDLIKGVRTTYRAAYVQANTNGDTGFRCASDV